MQLEKLRMSLSRRDVLRLGTGTAALLATGMTMPSMGFAMADEKKIPIALQLYSIRDLCAKDLPGTLAKVAKIGYQGVEFAGYYGRKSPELRKLLDDNGLKCCGTHTGLDTITGDAWKGTVEFNKEIGNPNLIVPWLPPERFSTIAAIDGLAKQFTELAAKAKEVGMRVGYHAHGGDFKKIEGETSWDRFFGACGPDVAMQLDIGNSMSGGGDPIAILKKFPGRAITLHVKEFSKDARTPVGEGDVKWDEVFKLCETIGKTEWYIVEQEAHRADPIDSVAACFNNLKKMGK
jgi:sugar phosphate isomerase/epimerase